MYEDRKQGINVGRVTLGDVAPQKQSEIDRESQRLSNNIDELERFVEELHNRLDQGGVLASPAPTESGHAQAIESTNSRLGSTLQTEAGRVAILTSRVAYITRCLCV